MPLYAVILMSFETENVYLIAIMPWCVCTHDNIRDYAHNSFYEKKWKYYEN